MPAIPFLRNAALGVVLLMSACAVDPVDVVPVTYEFAYPLDDVLRLNHLQAKGTHNSYHLTPETPGVAEWDYDHLPLAAQLADQGVRQFELDVHYSSADGRFAVYHVPHVDELSTCPWFTDCLREVKAWSDAHRGHHPIFIFIEPKDDIDPGIDSIMGRHDDLEAEILSVWPRNRILTPDDVRGTAATLAEAIETSGWPTLGEVRGHVVFVFLDRDRHTFQYTAGRKSLEGRLMFVTAELDEPVAGILALDDPIGQAELIAEAVSRGYIVRTRANDVVIDGVAESTERQEAALSGPAHIISTDFPVPGIIDGYGLDLVGGMPSLCNPLVAPAECTHDAIEFYDWLFPLAAPAAQSASGGMPNAR